MQFYDYLDWIEWPIEDVIEYAYELADCARISKNDTKYLVRRMLIQADPFRRKRDAGMPLIYPTKANAELLEKKIEAWSYDAKRYGQTLKNLDKKIYKLNVFINRPQVTSAEAEEHFTIFGSGLTSRYVEKFKVLSDRDKKELTRYPFKKLGGSIRGLADELYWRANYYPILGDWIFFNQDTKPYESLGWYAEIIQQYYYNARRQAELGKVEAAMYYAYKAGFYDSEADIQMTHGNEYMKRIEIRNKQITAGKSRKSIPNEIRIQTYWKYRNDGHKRGESGELAAQELRLSEASIRNAFPNNRYPPKKKV